MDGRQTFVAPAPTFVDVGLETRTMKFLDGPRKPFVWVGLPLFLVLFAYLCYSQPGIWIQFIGTPRQKALQMIEDLGGQYWHGENDPAAPIVAVDLGRTKVSGQDLVQLRGLPDLEAIYFGLDNLREEKLDALAALPRLQTLSFWRSPTFGQDTRIARDGDSYSPPQFLSDPLYRRAAALPGRPGGARNP